MTQEGRYGTYIEQLKAQNHYCFTFTVEMYVKLSLPQQILKQPISGRAPFASTHMVKTKQLMNISEYK